MISVNRETFLDVSVRAAVDFGMDECQRSEAFGPHISLQLTIHELW